ncbi:hypothetical protein C7974DRAFT_235770 [Boeremia exigua]|uniref:uncharacterized protein n=1 Tax=Boeremia exigua TaxID=749465 RepID=UPI001E8D149E|nr:uncharacterized protein C7974DRAFT_235770 [Boeremia exigua]KAH6620527.1 hypothetical protein C7974DRAFT_235770 [Boeremia exigua]
MGKLHFQPPADLTVADKLVLGHLQKDYEQIESTPPAVPIDAAEESDDSVTKRTDFVSPSPEDTQESEQQTIAYLKSVNNPKSDLFETSVFSTWDIADIKNPALRKWIIDPYIRWAKGVVRAETDVIMITHLIIYLCTSVPSALYLFYNFHWWHGVIHSAVQVYYMGPYTLLMHQHIHMRGVLNKKYAIIDTIFPYIFDPLMGHTWNSYFFHHVKHHHVEGNGPNDLSSTVRYQRDSLLHFMHYVGRFYLLVWFDLPCYFLRNNKTSLALKTGGCEIANYIFLYTLYAYVNSKAAIFVFLIPLALMRVALMTGNWGQHAFVDEEEPDSDFRSSITLIDAPSNRYCYNDGYHTSHHLNPLRHWRDHPVAFLSQKQQYADEHALVFYNIDYFMLTVTLLSKNYAHLARCLVPMGAQCDMTMAQREDMLRRKTRRFTEEEIAQKWGKQYAKLK